MSDETAYRIIYFLFGVGLALLCVLFIFLPVRDVEVIKLYTEGKYECATISDEFVCKRKKGI